MSEQHPAAYTCTSCGFATALCVCSDGPRDPETGETLSAAVADSAATLREYEVMQETIIRRVFTVPATSEDDAVKRWFHGEGEIARKEHDEWKLYAVEVKP